MPGLQVKSRHYPLVLFRFVVEIFPLLEMDHQDVSDMTLLFVVMTSSMNPHAGARHRTVPVLLLCWAISSFFSHTKNKEPACGGWRSASKGHATGRRQYGDTVTRHNSNRMHKVTDDER
jgi:hypothetical protein